MKSDTFPTVVKRSPRSNHLMVTYLYKLATGVTGNTSFPSPTPSGAALSGAADALAQANAKATDGGKAAVADRNAKRDDADDLVDVFVSYVQSTVKATASDPSSAAAMILSTGLSIMKPRTLAKQVLAARYGDVSGEVVLVALAVGRKAMYFWEHSSDQTHWTSVPSTLTSTTKIGGLTPGQVYYFRFRAQTRKGLGEYVDPVSLLVH